MGLVPAFALLLLRLRLFIGPVLAAAAEEPVPLLAACPFSSDAAAVASAFIAITSSLVANLPLIRGRTSA